jgi:hypothetical protein
VGPGAGLDGRKISSPPGFDPGPSIPLSVAVPTELPGPLQCFVIPIIIETIRIVIFINLLSSNCSPNWKTEETLERAVVTLQTERIKGSNP